MGSGEQAEGQFDGQSGDGSDERLHEKAALPWCDASGVVFI
jgi:hypothetical protein